MAGNKNLKTHIMTNGKDAINNSEQAPQDGLTKREYFAAMIMQGMVHEPPINFKRIAELSVEAADDLISKLNKTTV